MSLAITAVYAGLCALILFWLAFRVIGRRRGAKISLGDGNDPELMRLTRAHANATEWMPIFLILLAAAEAMGTPAFVLHPLGLAFVIGRALHAHHFITDRGDFQRRIIGMHLTLWPILGLAVGGIAHGLYRMIAG